MAKPVTKLTVQRAGPSTGDRSGAPELNTGILPGNVHADDWIFLTLAVAAVGLLGFVLLGDPSPGTSWWIFYADTTICAVFLIESLLRWRKRHWDPRFLLRNWYEVFAVLPATYPGFAGHHFILSVLLVLRIGRVADRALGEQFTYRLVDKLSEPIVYAIKKPVTVAVLDEVVKVLETGNYPENLARSLTNNKAELQVIIQEKLNEDPQLARFRRVPFREEITRAAVETSFRVVLEVLQDPRIDAFFSAVVRDNREQIRRAVELGLNEEDSEDKESLLNTRTQRAGAEDYDRRHGGHPEPPG